MLNENLKLNNLIDVVIKMWLRLSVHMNEHSNEWRDTRIRMCNSQMSTKFILFRLFTNLWYFLFPNKHKVVHSDNLCWAFYRNIVIDLFHEFLFTFVNKVQKLTLFNERKGSALKYHVCALFAIDTHINCNFVYSLNKSWDQSIALDLYK